MTLPAYQIAVISCQTGLTVGVFDSLSFYDLRYNRALNDIGALVLTLPYRSDLTTIFAKDNFIEVLRQNPKTQTLTVEDTFFSRLMHRFREGDEERFLVGGMSLNHLLARRVIDPADDPLGFGGYSTKAGPADEVLRAFAREQMGDLASNARQFPNFEVALVNGTGTPVGLRARYDELLKTFQELAQEGQVDFIVTRVSGNTLRLEIKQIGYNKTKTANYPHSPFVQFDPNRGNLQNPSLVQDSKKEANTCYALGQGQGDTRIVATVTGESIYDTPFNRIEFTTDVRKSERDNSLYLLTAARKAIRENKTLQEFTFEPVSDAAGNVYHLDYDLGDHITANWNNVGVDLRITDIEISVNRDGENLKVTLQEELIIQ